MRRCYLIAALLMVGLLHAATAKAASITFESLTVVPGQSFEIQVFGSDLLDVFAFGFDLTFDSAVLSFSGAREGDFLRTAGDTFFLVCPDAGLCPDGPPSIGATLLGPGSGADGGGLLASLIFTAVGVGDAGFQLTPFFLNSTFGEIPVEIIPGTIAAVPEPSTLGLLGIGLAALARKRLRRKPQTTA